MQRVRLKLDERFSNIFERWEGMVHQGLFKRKPYNTYREIKGIFSARVCDKCASPISQIDVEIGFHYISFYCPKCEKELMLDRTDYLAMEVIELIKKSNKTERVNTEPLKEVLESELLVSREDIVKNEPVQTIKNNENRGGNSMLNINSMFKGFEFGPVKGDAFKLSPLGTAFKAKEGYVVYNAKNDEVTDVTGMTFDANNMIFAMPISHSKVAENDIVLHNGVALVVKEVKEKSIVVVYPGMSEIKEIMPVKNMFGFNFYTKITALLDLSGSTKPDSDNPFGNLMPLMLMSQIGNGEGGMNPIALMALMGDKLGGDGGFPKEMMLALALSGGNGNGNSGNDMLTALMMSKAF